ncbi:MAG: hypothetical protein M3Q52_07820 [Pseudomonadota bacterium]|nr:hypothetical protein [Pseudomonadota bacterium]
MLTLTKTGGTDANWTAVLKAITYYDSSDAPAASSRTINVTATDNGSSSSLTSTATVSVSTVNDAPSGSVTISGDAVQGETLSASNNLVDADGLGTITYQWLRGGVAIDGATGSSYALTEADVGAAITVVASYSDGHGTAEAVASVATGAIAEGVLVVGTEGDDVLNGTTGNDELQGGGGDDILVAGAGNDILDGGEGNDLLQGGTGADQMSGGIGNDDYYVDDAADVVLENAGEGADRILSSIDYVLAAGVSIERLQTHDGILGSASISLSGNELAQRIAGNSGTNSLSGGGGDDILVAGAGNDILDGGEGNDLLQGGTGADIFLFGDALDAGIDRLIDFNVNEDMIHLEQSAFAGLDGAGLLPESAFHTGSSAQDADDRIVYDPSTGNIYFDADGNGYQTQILIAAVALQTALTSDCFYIVG